MRRALLIGNGTFVDQRIPSLASPIPDTERLGLLLSKAEVGDYQVSIYLNESSWKIRKEVQKFFDAAGLDDTLLVYLSGHGIKDSEGRLHFGTSDTDPDTVNATSLEAKFLHERMDNSLARKKILLIDSCYSGAFALGWDAKNVTGSVTKEEFGHHDTIGKVVITASTSVQASFENAEGLLKQSRFTKHLIEGIETGAADRNQSGLITVDELYDYVRSAMRQEAANNPDVPPQNPQRWTFGLDGAMMIAKNPCAVTQKIPDTIAKKLQSNEPRDVASAIDELVDLARRCAISAGKANDTVFPFVESDSILVSTVARRAIKRLKPFLNAQTQSDLAPRASLAELPLDRRPSTSTKRGSVSLIIMLLVFFVALYAFWPVTTSLKSQEGVAAPSEPRAGMAVPTVLQEPSVAPPQSQEGVAAPSEPRAGMAVPTVLQESSVAPPQSQEGVAAPSEPRAGMAVPTVLQEPSVAPPQSQEGVAAPSEPRAGMAVPTVLQEPSVAPPQSQEGVAAPSEPRAGMAAPSEPRVITEDAEVFSLESRPLPSLSEATRPLPRPMARPKRKPNASLHDCTKNNSGLVRSYDLAICKDEQLKELSDELDKSWPLLKVSASTKKTLEDEHSKWIINAVQACDLFTSVGPVYNIPRASILCLRDKLKDRIEYMSIYLKQPSEN